MLQAPEKKQITISDHDRRIWATCQMWIKNHQQLTLIILVARTAVRLPQLTGIENNRKS